MCALLGCALATWPSRLVATKGWRWWDEPAGGPGLEALPGLGWRAVNPPRLLSLLRYRRVPGAAGPLPGRQLREHFWQLPV